MTADREKTTIGTKDAQLKRGVWEEAKCAIEVRGAKVHIRKTVGTGQSLLTAAARGVGPFHEVEGQSAKRGGEEKKRGGISKHKKEKRWKVGQRKKKDAKDWRGSHHRKTKKNTRKKAGLLEEDKVSRTRWKLVRKWGF